LGIEVHHSGSFDNTTKFLRSIINGDIFRTLDRLGQEGVQALSAATPIDTGLAASQWDYEVIRDRGMYQINWLNRDVEGGAQVVILIQYGHGTGTGGYVQGRDFINPAMRPIFDRIANEAWEAVTRA
jgi:hypothetical protein